MNFQQSSIFSALASFGLLFINLFTSMIIARLLGPEQIGRYQVFVTTQTFISTICALGIGQSCIYFINALKYKERKVLSTSINSTFPIAVLVSIILFLLIIFIPGYFGQVDSICLLLFCMGTTAMLLNNIFTPVLLVNLEVVRNQIVKYSSALLTLLVLVGVLLLEIKLTVDFLIAMLGATTIISTIILYYFFRDRFRLMDGIDFKLLRNIIKWGVKLSGNNIASITLASVPIYFLTWFSLSDGLLNVGYYSRAVAALVVGTVLAASIGPLLYSKWSTVSGEQLKNQVKRASMLFILVNVTIALLLMILAPFLIVLMYGEEFRYAIPLLQILALSLVANSIKEICYSILSSQGKPLKILKNLLIGIIFCAVLNYFLIPYWGAVAVAIVTTITSFMTAFLLIRDVTLISVIETRDFFTMPKRRDVLNILSNILKIKK